MTQYFNYDRVLAVVVHHQQMPTVLHCFAGAQLSWPVSLRCQDNTVPAAAGASCSLTSGAMPCQAFQAWLHAYPTNLPVPKAYLAYCRSPVVVIEE